MTNLLRRLFAPRAGVHWPMREPSARPADAQVRRIETEHFRFTATRQPPEKQWRVTAEPISAAARYWAQSQGYGDDEGVPYALETTLPLDHLPAYIDHLQAHLVAYWGPALDSHRQWRA